MHPWAAHAQLPAQTFEQLRQAITNGETVVVTDTAGRRTTGRVADVTADPPSLVILIPQRHTVPAETVAEIRRRDALWNGALVGAGVGAGLATWDYAIDPSEPGNGVVFAIAIGTGAAIGAGIDALTKGRLLYRTAPSTARVSLAPLVTRRTQGLLLTARF